MLVCGEPHSPEESESTCWYNAHLKELNLFVSSTDAFPHP